MGGFDAILEFGFWIGCGYLRVVGGWRAHGTSLRYTGGVSTRIPHNPLMILSVGTKVVLRAALRPRDSAGAVGVIVKSPVDQRHSYRVRFPDGSEAPLRRTEFTVLKELQAEAAGLTGGTPVPQGGNTADTAVAPGRRTADTAVAPGTAGTVVTHRDALADFDLYACVIHRCIVGSRVSLPPRKLTLMGTIMPRSRVLVLEFEHRLRLPDAAYHLDRAN